MKDLLVEGLTNDSYQQITFNHEGTRNVEILLDSLEMIARVLEKPNESVYWLDYDSARRDGIRPSVWKYLSIIEKHFPMSLNDFLHASCDYKLFQSFEDECLKSCARLDHEQIFRAHTEVLYLYELTSIEI